MARILAVDDNPSSLEFARLTLEAEGHEVRTAKDGVEGLLAVEEELPDLIVTDLQMPKLDGMGLLSRVRQRWSDLPVIVVSVQEDVALVVEAIRQGAQNYVLKPFSPEAISSAVTKALVARPTASTSKVEPESAASEIRGRSPALVEVRHLVALAARCDVNLLITGETGTGKEVVSRAVHKGGKFADKPFIAHNCAATPHELFESHFFGHKKGSFTGAVQDHVGLIEAADGGVLFLDELNSMAPEHQAKLLRVIDDGEVRRVGTQEEKRVTVRFFAAMNQPPEELIRSGKLREDLYYRLRGIEFHLPPLRERREDIAELAEHFLPEGAPGFTREALEALEAHDWPGNVRELKNVVQSALVFAGDGEIEVAHLNLRAAASTPKPAADETTATTGMTLKELEQSAILRALEEAGGNKAKAAQALGIDRSTLWRKLSAMGLADK